MKGMLVEQQRVLEIATVLRSLTQKSITFSAVVPRFGLMPSVSPKSSNSLSGNQTQAAVVKEPNLNHWTKREREKDNSQ